MEAAAVVDLAAAAVAIGLETTGPSDGVDLESEKLELPGQLCIDPPIEKISGSSTIQGSVEAPAPLPVSADNATEALALVSDGDTPKQSPLPPEVDSMPILGCNKDTVWMHGVAEFPHNRNKVKYLIVPAECEDILQALAVACSAWNMELPKLFVEVDGFHDVAHRWYDQLLQPDVWKTDGCVEGSIAENVSARKMFLETVDEICQGVLTACGESNAWVYTYVDNVGHDFDDRFNFEAKVQLIGRARRQGREVAAQSVPILAGHHMGHMGLYGEQQFRDNAVPVGEGIEKHVKYPRMSHMYVKDNKTPLLPSERPHLPKAQSVLQGECTHLFLFDNGCPLNFADIRDGMQKLVPSVMLVAHGAPHMLHWAVNVSKFKPVILMRHTGGAADVVAKAVMRRAYSERKGKDCSQEEPVEYKFHSGEEVSFVLPRSVQSRQFFVLDSKNDMIESIVDKIIQCVSVVEDEEMRQLGSQPLEIARLERAWRMHLTYKNQSASWGRLASIFQYLMILVTLLITVASVIALKEKPEESDPGPKYFWYWPVVTLPVISTFLLSSDSAFSPLAKWSKLAIAAGRVKAEIYTYRARVGIYAPRIFRSKSLQVLQTHLDLAMQQGGGIAKLVKEDAAHNHGGDKSSGGSQYETRRGAFAATLQEIQADLYKSEFRDASLQLVQESAFATYRQVQRRLSKKKLQLGKTSSEGSAHTVGDTTFKSVVSTGEEDSVSVGSLSMSVDTLADDLLLPLSTDEYINFRVKPLLDEYETLAPRLAVCQRIGKTLVFTSAAASTLLALADQTMLVPVATGFSSAVIATMSFESIVHRLECINSAKLALENLLVWWESRSLFQKRLYETKLYIVDTTERSQLSLHSWFQAAAAPKHKREREREEHEKDR